MSNEEALILPLLPLPFGVVLLPGVSLQVPVSGRSDIVALLSKASNEWLDPNSKVFKLGCVPINSPLLRSDGQTLSKQAGQILDRDDAPRDAGQVDYKRLFMYGTIANTRLARSRQDSDLRLVVEGISRFRVDRFVQMKPHFMAESAIIHEANGSYYLKAELANVWSDILEWQ